MPLNGLKKSLNIDFVLNMEDSHPKKISWVEKIVEMMPLKVKNQSELPLVKIVPLQLMMTLLKYYLLFEKIIFVL